MEIDLPRLYQTVQSLGGLKEVIEKKKWPKVSEIMRIPKSAQDRVTKLDDIYCKYLLPYDTLSPGIFPCSAWKSRGKVDCCSWKGEAFRRSGNGMGEARIEVPPQGAGQNQQPDVVGHRIGFRFRRWGGGVHRQGEKHGSECVLSDRSQYHEHVVQELWSDGPRGLWICRVQTWLYRYLWFFTGRTGILETCHAATEPYMRPLGLDWFGQLGLWFRRFEKQPLCPARLEFESPHEQ